MRHFFFSLSLSVILSFIVSLSSRSTSLHLSNCNCQWIYFLLSPLFLSIFFCQLQQKPRDDDAKLAIHHCNTHINKKNWDKCIRKSSRTDVVRNNSYVMNRIQKSRFIHTNPQTVPEHTQKTKPYNFSGKKINIIIFFSVQFILERSLGRFLLRIYFFQQLVAILSCFIIHIIKHILRLKLHFFRVSENSAWDS